MNPADLLNQTLCQFLQDRPWSEAKNILETNNFLRLIIKEDTIDGSPVFLAYYNQCKTNFLPHGKMKNEIAYTARGHAYEIVDPDLGIYRRIRTPLDKFWEHTQKGATDTLSVIDFSESKIYDKRDGSMILMYNFKDRWYTSTLKTFCGTQAPTNGSEYDTFYDLAESVLQKYPNFSFDHLDTEYTYMFELTSPHNRVVVEYCDDKMHLLAIRHNETGQEIDIHTVDIGIPPPDLYTFDSLEDCVRSFEYRTPIETEGHIVVYQDERGDIHRVKIKHPTWCDVHLYSGSTDNSAISLRVIHRGFEASASDFLRWKIGRSKNSPLKDIYLQTIGEFPDLKNRWQLYRDTIIGIRDVIREEFVNEDMTDRAVKKALYMRVKELVGESILPESATSTIMQIIRGKLDVDTHINKFLESSSGCKKFAKLLKGLSL